MRSTCAAVGSAATIIRNAIKSRTRRFTENLRYAIFQVSGDFTRSASDLRMARAGIESLRRHKSNAGAGIVQWLLRFGSGLGPVALDLQPDGLSVSAGGFERKSLLQVLLGSGTVFVVEVGACENEVSFGAGLKTQRPLGFATGLRNLVLEKQRVSESCESAGILWLKSQCLAELVLSFGGSTI